MSAKKNFSLDEFEKGYAQHGSPLAYRGEDQRRPDYSDWRMTWHPNVSQDSLDMAETALICCPEDHQCDQGCVPLKRLCLSCEVPMCRACSVEMSANRIAPLCLANDNFVGYMDAWLYENDIT